MSDVQEMKILHLITITVFLITTTVLLTTSHHAYASPCPVKETIYSAPEFYLLSDNVFVGNVTSITDYGNHQWQVHFDIEKIWKGTATRQTSTVMAHTIQACGYSITVGEKYLIYTNGSPSTINPISSKMYSDAQNDIALFDDPKFQSEEKTKEELNKKLDAAQGRVESMMTDKSSHIPINGVGVDEVNSTLDIMIDDERATLSVEQYTQNLKTILGDIPIKVEFGYATTALPILHNANDSGQTTSHPIIHESNFSNVLKSPMQQFKSGIVANDVKCAQDLQLVIKTEDNSPACVKPDTAQKLVERGWALETNNPKLTHMNIKVFSSYTPSSLADHFLTGSLYSSAEPIQNGNITITVNEIVMGTTQTYPNGCFQFNNWNDSKLRDQINKSKSLGISSMELNFQTQYFGDSNHNPANASAVSYLGFYAVPLAPAQYDMEVYPSNQINVTQGDSAQFHITVKPFSKYWEVGHMKLNLQRMPCGLSYDILPVDNNDSVSVNNTSSFDVVLNSTSYTPSGKYWIFVDQDLSEINKPNIGSNIGAFILNVLKK